jgi:hypothetical protein
MLQRALTESGDEGNKGKFHSGGNSDEIELLSFCSERVSFTFVVRFEVFTAVTMKNVDFWDIKTQFVLHRRHITSPLPSLAG